MKYFLPLQIVLLVASSVWAQSKMPEVMTMHKVFFLNPSYEFEGRLSSRGTFVISPGFGFALATQSSSLGVDTDFFFAPVVSGGFRQYYNLAKRQREGRSIFGNSGNFLTVLCYIVGSPLNSPQVEVPESTVTPAVAWGFQRTYRQNLNVTFLVGIGYFSSRFKTYTKVGETPVAQLKIGYAFLKRDRDY